MKRSHLLTQGLVCVLAAVVLCGCAMFAGGPSDEELITAKLDAWKAGFVAKDIDAILAVYSDKFTHYEVSDKDGLREFLEGAVDMGYLEDIEVNAEEAEITIDGESAVVYPIDLSSAAGSVTIELTFTKEGDDWMVSTMDIEGL
ncbi:MAG TPA: nuclear transport factor 2 family protein [Candidatus Hydrogenedentes bacterium]|nr:nuclear transport factor 2 family protein [Candidatus Hydrogenedentota bacterium]HPG65235.1 nuclear transport factor 2 family protein [Candidatus Hydrogenedentota bacterium]